MDLDDKHRDAPNEERGPSRTQSRRQESDSVDDKLHRQIEALIPRLTRYARVLTHDPVAADDLVQECLTRALGKLHLWEQGTDLRAWLFTILHHQHVSCLRRDARQRTGIQLQQFNSGLTCAPDQAARLELRDVERALAKLPEEQRSVILLVGLEGMRYDQAASIANLPVGTVRSRVARGRETLRVTTGLFPSRHSRGSGASANPASASRPARRRSHFKPSFKEGKSASRPQEVFQ
jgi:RNA polymerase sigma-70 factor, ECF subfamily